MRPALCPPAAACLTLLISGMALPPAFAQDPATDQAALVDATGDVREEVAVEETDDFRIYVAAGADGWISPETGGHGYVLASYQRDDVFRELDVDLTYNTDTLQLTGRGLEISKSLKIGAFLKGQALFAGLLMDYYQQGLRVPERGFRASYVQGGVLIETNTDGPVFVELELGGRRWFFGSMDDTSPELVLPPEMWVFEPRLRFTGWNFEHDEAFVDAHRHRWRLRGWGVGAELGVDFRSGWDAWGALDPQAFQPVDERNRLGRTPMTARVWLAGGLQLARPLRIQGRLFLSGGEQEDDLTRTRVGGLNPYVLQVPGVPWAAFLPQNFGAAQASVHVLTVGQIEVGLEGTAVTMDEEDALRVDVTPFREGAVVEYSPLDEQLYGVGLFADARVGPYQVDVTLGWAPPVRALADESHFSGWLSLGREF